MVGTEPNFGEQAFVEQALNGCNVNALRMALFHQTGDPRLSAMTVNQIPAQGGAMIIPRLDRAHHDDVRDLALQYLLGEVEVRPPPTKAETAELLTLFTGEEPNETELHWAYENLAFADNPHDTTWTADPPTDKLADFEVTIVGAGFSGIAVGIQLDRLGVSYRIIEKNAGIGGTWYINDYPQARVDIPSFLYQYRFVKNYPWKSYFATADELREYLSVVIDQYQLEDRISLNTELTDAEWNEDTQRWDLQLRGPDGRAEHVHSNVVVSCVGLFNRPNLPDIDGIDEFEGAMFHTTAWDHRYDYSGKRVALIGTGSTGSQLMPEVAEKAGHLSVFQRTPNWVNPVAGYKTEVPPPEHWLLANFPGYWNWVIHAAAVEELQLQPLQMMDPGWIAAGGRVNRRNDLYAARLTEFIRSKVGDDDELFRKLIPSYAPLARRLVIDNGFYDALQQDNVDLVTDNIARFTATGIATVHPVTGTEEERPFDMIVLGAGFRVGEYLWPVEYKGRNGTTLEELWAADGARAYLGLVMPHFPNFFSIYGPNGQARGGSFHVWAAAFGRYIGGLIVHLLESEATSFEVRKEVYDRYNTAMDKEHENLLWEHEGQGGYYVNEHGRSGVNMPWTQHQYYEMIRVPNPGDYSVT